MCMEALKAIGLQKALRFVVFQFAQVMLHASIFPPLRSLLLRLFGAQIGKDTVIMDVSLSNMHHYGLRKFYISNRCFVGDEVMLDVRGGITLEDNVTLSNRCHIVTHINVGYDTHPLQMHYPVKESPVVVKQGAYIGSNALILPGVTIGRESVVGAGAVVTRNVEAHTVVAGVPARVIKKISV